MPDDSRCFTFLRMNERAAKPRSRGVTEIRGPYYTPMGKRYLHDLLETVGAYIDTLKFAGGSFTLIPRTALVELIELCHQYHVRVSTGGFIEYVFPQGVAAVGRYLAECRELGFDIVEVSSGFVSLPADDLVGVARQVQQSGLKAKPEIGIQFGAGGATPTGELESEGTQDVGRAVRLARQYLDAGVEMIMVESEGITENVTRWRTDVIARLANELGTENLMFEASDPDVFAWYVKTYGPEVNLFVDHSQIVQLECLRRGIWGTKDLWGRVLTYKP